MTYLYGHFRELHSVDVIRVFPQWRPPGAARRMAHRYIVCTYLEITLADTDPAPHVFNASMGARLEVLYASPQIVAQRRRFRALLDVREGESGVDVGCGVGHLTCELAEDVGAGGRMTGVDASTDMLAGAAARVHARRLDDRVALREGDATALGLPDASADFVVAVQTYSYVPDIAAAIAEAARVLRPGGRLGVLETDWDLYVYGSPDVELMRRIFDGRWRFEHAHLPRQLNRLFADAGLTPTHAEAFPAARDELRRRLVRRRHARDRPQRRRPPRRRSRRRRRLGRRRARARRAGDWFFCLNRFMFVATKP